MSRYHTISDEAPPQTIYVLLHYCDRSAGWQPCEVSVPTTWEPPQPLECACGRATLLARYRGGERVAYMKVEFERERKHRRAGGADSR